MKVTRSEWFQIELKAELDSDDRPSVDHFETQLGRAVELTFAYLWDDPRHVAVDEQTGVRTTMTVPVRPYMFPPGVFYARQLDDETVEMIGVEFDWGYWEQVAGPYEPS